MKIVVDSFAVSVDPQRLDDLQLPLMVKENTDPLHFNTQLL